MFRLLIDNGHGVDTKGKRSPDNRLLEYKYVREIGAKVTEFFNEFYPELPVHTIVPEEIDISLADRVKRVNDIVAAYPLDQCFLVSIHVNAADPSPWTTARGWQVHCARKASNASITLANNFTKVAQDLGVKVRLYNGTQNYWPNDFYIIKNTKCPAILTENFFMNNKKDLEYLLSDEGRETVTNIHIGGILTYLGWPWSYVKA